MTTTRHAAKILPVLLLLAAVAARAEPTPMKSLMDSAAQALKEQAGDAAPAALQDAMGGNKPKITARPPEAPVADPSVFTRSLLFSSAELAAIQRAMAGTVSGTAAIEANKAAEPIPQRRTISVAGVVWRSPTDWIVWLNGHKVTPKNLLPEIVEIKVDRQQVRLKWFDRGINDVISIALRPHQTYDIVTGVLLPG